LLCFLAVLPNLQPHHPSAHLGFMKGFQHLLNNPTTQILAIITYIMSVCTLVCCGVDKKVPVNYFLLGLVTFSMSWIVASVTTRCDPIIVFEAAILTFAVVFAITVYAYTTSTDFTVFGPILHIFGFVFCTAGALMCLFGYHPGLLWSVLGVILFSFYLLFDT
jgi:FtsH-binding integral membrane protein